VNVNVIKHKIHNTVTVKMTDVKIYISMSAKVMSRINWG